MYYKINIARLYLVFITLILSLDISSNFIMPSMTVFFSALRDGSSLVLFCFFARNWRISTKKMAITIIFLSLVLISYGIVYCMYFVRFLVYFMLLQELICRNYSLRILFVVPIFLMFAFFYIPDQVTNQGFRFFSGNATVVGLFLLSLYYSERLTFLKLITSISIFLTGSLSAIVGFTLSVLNNVRYLFLLLLILLILPFLIPDGETSRRLASMISLLSGDFTSFLSVLTLGARLDQFEFAINHHDFDLLMGLPMDTFVGAAGIESQLLHFIAFGGLLGTATCLAAVMSFVLLSGVKLRISSGLILFIVFLTLRVFESVGAVIAVCIILNIQKICYGSEKNYEHKQ